jgi:hypothetical protein
MEQHTCSITPTLQEFVSKNFPPPPLLETVNYGIYRELRKISPYTSFQRGESALEEKKSQRTLCHPSPFEKGDHRGLSFFAASRGE